MPRRALTDRQRWSLRELSAEPSDRIKDLSRPSARTLHQWGRSIRAPADAGAGKLAPCVRPNRPAARRDWPCYSAARGAFHSDVRTAMISLQPVRVRIAGRAYGLLRCSSHRRTICWRWVWGRFHFVVRLCAPQMPLSVAVWGWPWRQTRCDPPMTLRLPLASSPRTQRPRLLTRRRRRRPRRCVPPGVRIRLPRPYPPRPVVQSRRLSLTFIVRAKLRSNYERSRQLSRDGERTGPSLA